MQLTSLEIKGFKSFADKTLIKFDQRITGIVGPNGCGKSNVIDSIRWVLGEQKTSMLRSEKMENLIFNGTKKKKASGLAEVSLTFENTKNLIPLEYSSVTITRRLYRDGDSEYRLNDVPCRLKDIANLFLDTGVSSDSYAIIELGMIDEILNDRDNSRRKLFEQAAGISKFKRRKKETMSKLKGTEADLDRVEDLLFEIENNLKTLESQARRARRYKKLKEKYKELSVELAKLRLRSINQRYEELKSATEKETDVKLKLESESKKVDANLEQVKLGSLEKEKQLAEIQRKLNLLISGVGQQENDRNLLKEQLRYAEEKIDSGKKRMVELEERKRSLSLEIEEVQNRINERAGETEGARKELENYQLQAQEKKSSFQQLYSGLNEKRSKLETLERTIFELEKKKAVNLAGIENLIGELNRNHEETDLRSRELEQLNIEAASLRKSAENAQALLDKMLAETERLSHDINARQKNIEELQTKLASESRLLDANKNEYDLTKSLVENLEGFPESIKFLKKNSNWSKSAPLLSDLIYCDEDYRVAIENYLDSYLNYYVVGTYQEAVNAIELLSSSAKGRASFFVLEEFGRYQPAQPKILAEAKPATEIVELESPFSRLGAFLLDKVYIVDDAFFDAGKQLDPKNQGMSFITRSGKFHKSDFRLSGGAVGLFEGKKIGRTKNLEKLSKKIKTLDSKTHKIRETIHELREGLGERKQRLEEITLDNQRSELGAITNKLASIKARIEQHEHFLVGVNRKKEDAKKRIAELGEENSKIEVELIELQDQFTSEGENLGLHTSQLEEARGLMAQASESYNSFNIEFIKQQNLLATLEQQKQFKRSQLEEAEKSIAKIEQEDVQLKTELGSNRTKLKELESTLLLKYTNKEDIEKEVSGAEDAYYQSKEQINVLDTRSRELFREKDKSEKALQELSVNINQVKMDLNSIKERLSIEFGLRVEEVLDHDSEMDYDLETLENEVTKTKGKIENFGDINPMAIEAHEEMQKRFDFIGVQKKDLLDSKENLLKTIEEIEDNAKVKFNEAFNSVRENFIKVFRTLFSDEDDCDLILLTPDTPLESKIEIVAKPKGKRPQIIDQLSGGEKTLTATALLFALYLLKPAPFCIFDEVDAPLDDTNIAKFNKIIKQFSGDSQFIIVTHNKQTMNSVDVIYGVTMAEPGISRVVPVDFRSLN